MRRNGKRYVLLALVLLGLVVCPACQWVQNEFFVLDVAAPPDEPEPAQTVPW